MDIDKGLLNATKKKKKKVYSGRAANLLHYSFYIQMAKFGCVKMFSPKGTFKPSGYPCSITDFLLISTTGLGLRRALWLPVELALWV